MMMFASDLDRTLIYSDRALSEFGHAGKDGLVGVERKGGQAVAFMTKKAHKALKEISGQMLFVPVTTRTLDQYKRVFIFQENMPVTYAVTSNGANIFYHGKSLPEWDTAVQQRLKNECALIEDMIAASKAYELNGSLKKADNLFFYYILSDQLTTEEKNRMSKIAESNGWRVSLQGKKLYFVPNPVCKGEAVKFIKEREGIHSIFGAGDSLLDHDFLKVCDFPYVPNHGELAKDKTRSLSYHISQNTGVKAGEEILSAILGSIKKKQRI